MVVIEYTLGKLSSCPAGVELQILDNKIKGRPRQGKPIIEDSILAHILVATGGDVVSLSFSRPHAVRVVNQQA